MVAEKYHDQDWEVGIAPRHAPDREDIQYEFTAPMRVLGASLTPFGVNRAIDRLSSLSLMAQAYYLASLAAKVKKESFLSAIIGNRETAFSSLRDKIEALEDEWRSYNWGRSVYEYNHFAHYQIIGMGSAALPLILERVESGSNKWFIALRAITGLMIDTPDMRGNPDAAREAWVHWGRQHGYLESQALGDDSGL